MKNILFYGNCQLEKIKDILCLPSTSYNINYIFCFNTTLSDLEFDKILKDSDIIITQPIEDNYRDMYYLSSNYIVNKCNPNSVIIFVNNCHLDFYYFDLIYNKFNTDYCHKNMIDCIQNKYDYTYYQQNYIENKDLKTSNELNEIFHQTICNLEERFKKMHQYTKYNTYFINIIDFIKENYKKKLLFYTFNHPTKYLLQFIAEKIIQILCIPNTINYNLDPFSNDKFILYSCLQKVVDFDIKEHNLSINLSDIYNFYTI